MPFLIVVLALVCAFLVLAAVIEWATERLGEPAPYRDDSRGTRRH